MGPARTPVGRSAICPHPVHGLSSAGLTEPCGHPESMKQAQFHPVPVMARGLRSGKGAGPSELQVCNVGILSRAFDTETLKLIVAVIHPSQLGVVKNFLFRLGLRDLVVTDFRREIKRTARAIYRGFALPIEMVSQLRLEIPVDDDDENVVIKTILHGVRTVDKPKRWEGRILVFQLENLVRIDSGQSGIAAL